MRTKVVLASSAIGVGLLFSPLLTTAAVADCASTYPAAQCAAPSVSPATDPHPAATAAASAKGGGGLAFTGVDAAALAAVGVGAVGAGVGLTLAARRRSS